MKISEFFYRTKEININELMFEKQYDFPIVRIIEYICDVCSFSFKDALDYIDNLNYLEPVTSENIFQFSSLCDCTENICIKLDENGDTGFRYNEVGRLLCGTIKRDSADRKYGENASKTSRELGLTQIIDNYVFLSCLGKAYPLLSDEKKKKLLAMLIIRSTYFTSLLNVAKKIKIESTCLMSGLSDSTITRRKSNVKKLLLVLREMNDDYLNERLDNIIV